MMMQLIRRKKALAIILGLSVLSLLVIWDIHTLRQQAGSSEYNSGVLEVRKYSGELGVFRVLYSKLRDVNEANILLAAKSNLDVISADGAAGDGEEAQVAGGGERGVMEIGDELEKNIEKVVATMRFKPLTQAPHDETAQGSYENEENDDTEERNEENDDTEEHNEEKKSVENNLVFRPLQHDIDSVSYPTVMAKPKSQSPPDIEDIQPRDHDSISILQRQKTTFDVIKKLLLHNETESAEALWAVAQNQHSVKKISQTTPAAVQPQISSARKTNKQFHVQSSMSWPLPQFTRRDILQSQWVEDLKQYLRGITEWRQISVVTANIEHQEVVLNWLISAVTVAKLSLRNILVLSISVKLHEFLISKKINSILVHPTSVMNKVGLKRITSAFNQIHIVRLTFFRLMSHWAYDVVMYDSDAVVLKNPQPLFDANAGVELVGSAGKGPESIGHMWGRTICTGVLLMRSSPDLEIWWEKMSRVARLPFTDQGLVNIALKSLHVHWDQISPLYVDRDMHGSCKNTQLEAVILSEEKICRYHCDSRKRSQYYVWHKPAIKRNRTVQNKRERAREGGAWLLRDNWTQLSKMTSLTGVTWLLSISHNT